MSEREIITILITGTSGVGKTRFIEAVSELGCISAEIKGFTGYQNHPLWLDFGRISLVEDYRLIYFFANIGNGIIPEFINQSNLQHILKKAQMAYLVIVDNRTVDSEGHDRTAEIKKVIETIQARNCHYLLLANKRKDVAAYSLTEMRMRLGLAPEIPFIETDIVSHPDSAKLILAELFNMLPQNDLVQAAIAKLSENI